MCLSNLKNVRKFSSCKYNKYNPMFQIFSLEDYMPVKAYHTVLQKLEKIDTQIKDIKK